ncbi:unnamed protein product [Ectocarpus sp. 12 AP-2014]
MSAARVEQASASDNSSGSRAAGLSLQALEEKARRLLKRCRYDDAAKTFKTLLEVAQVQRDAAAGRGRQQQEHGPYPKKSWSLEIGALEGLAICLSRQLDVFRGSTLARMCTWRDSPSHLQYSNS